MTAPRRFDAAGLIEKKSPGGARDGGLHQPAGRMACDDLNIHGEQLTFNDFRGTDAAMDVKTLPGVSSVLCFPEA